MIHGATPRGAGGSAPFLTVVAWPGWRYSWGSLGSHQLVLRGRLIFGPHLVMLGAIPGSALGNFSWCCSGDPQGCRAGVKPESDACSSCRTCCATSGPSLGPWPAVLQGYLCLCSQASHPPGSGDHVGCWGANARPAARLPRPCWCCFEEES